MIITEDANFNIDKILSWFIVRRKVMIRSRIIIKENIKACFLMIYAIFFGVL
jgi:hypothetical protein